MSPFCSLLGGGFHEIVMLFELVATTLKSVGGLLGPMKCKCTN